MIANVLMGLMTFLSVTGVTSMLWPLATKAPRPSPLQTIHDVIIKTPMGKQAEAVLGITDGKNEEITPTLSLTTIAASAASSIAETAEARVIQSIVSQLSEKQKETLRNMMCTP